MPRAKLEQTLREAKQAFQKAVEARAAMRLEEARRAFLQAAEALLVAAALSSGLLRERRKELALNLQQEAERLQQELKQGGRTTPQKLPVSAEREDPSADWLVIEKPPVRFEDIAGLDEVKEQIRLKLLYPFTHPELAAQYNLQAGGGLLLYGPPGTGKTMIARAVAGEIQAAFFAVKPSEIMSQWVGVAEQNLARLFAEADRYPLSVVFIDEIEALAPRRRASASTVMVRLVPQLLAELDGFEKRKNPLLVIGATNEPWAMDHALLRPGRFDRLIYVPPPDETARYKILTLNLQNIPLSHDCDLTEIAKRTEGFSGADLAGLTQAVRERAFSLAIQTGEAHFIRAQDFEAVLETLHPSIHAKDLALYEKFAQKGALE